jgi:glucose-6-phosphate 1-dehydrogenase
VSTQNPFADPLRFERRVPECAVVIFGATGDLTKRKLMPALYRLAYERRLPTSFAVIGNARSPLSDDAFRDSMRESVKRFLEDSPFDEELWTSFARNLRYVAGNLNDANLYSTLGAKISELGQSNVLFYLSIQRRSATISKAPAR